MSFARRDNDTRRARRRQLASPYARPSSAPTAKKSSGWSLATLWNSINPFRSKSRDGSSDEEEEVEDVVDDDDEFQEIQPPTPPTGAVSREMQELQNALNADVLLNFPLKRRLPPPPSRAIPVPQFKTPQRASSSRPLPIRSGAPPPSSPLRAPFDGSASPSPSLSNLEKVQAFLAEKNGAPLNSIEQAGINLLLKEEETSEPFKFRYQSASPPTTPSRGAGGSRTTLSFGQAASSASGMQGSGIPVAPRMLKRNPNGEMRWTGGGSARPRASRRNNNKIASPAFGPSQNNTRIPVPAQPSDGKRRRVGEDASTSSAQPSGPAKPSPSPLSSSQSAPTVSSTGATNGSANGANGLARSSTLGFPSTPRYPTKATAAPAVPSPLRQAWSNNSPTPSPPHSRTFPNSSGIFTSNGGLSTPTPANGAPTKSASIMAEIIKDASPVKKTIREDVMNPYQTASPVKPPPPKKPPPRKPKVKTEKKSTASGANGVNGTSVSGIPAPVAAPSPRAIIEATVPKGSKRSRPPTTLDSVDSQETEVRRSARLRSKSPDPSPSKTMQPSRFSAFMSDSNENDEDDEDDMHASKKKKAVNGTGRRTMTTVEVEEVADEDVKVKVAKPTEVIEPDSATNGKTAPPPPTNSYSFTSSASSGSSSIATANGSSTSSTTATSKVSGFGFKTTAPKEPSKLRQSQSFYDDEDFSASTEKKDKDNAVNPPARTSSLGSAVPFSAFPTSIFGGKSGNSFSTPALTASALADKKDDDSRKAEPAPFGTSIFGKEMPAFGASGITPSPAPPSVPSTPFTFAPATSSPIASTSAEDPEGRAKEDAKKVVISALPAFSWKVDGSSTSVSTKDEVENDAARQQVTALSVSSLPSYSFTFSDIKSQGRETAANGTAPSRTSSSSSFGSSFSSSPNPTAGAVSFNWSAAGSTLKPPSRTPSYDGETWTCGTCMLKNPVTAMDKCTVCDADRPGSKSNAAPALGKTGTFGSGSSLFRSSSLGSGSFTTSATTASGGGGSFNWGAAGMKLKPATSEDGAWTCGTCMLKNPASAKTKCTVCDADRPASASSSSSNLSPPPPPLGAALPITSSTNSSSASDAGGGFNWAAAGMKPPSDADSASGGGSWTCGTCMLSNPASAKEKCSVCDAPR